MRSRSGLGAVLNSALFSDGTHLYFTVSLDTGDTPAQVSVRGGDVAPIHPSLPAHDAVIMGISPDGAELLVDLHFHGR